MGICGDSVTQSGESEKWAISSSPKRGDGTLQYSGSDKPSVNADRFHGNDITTPDESSRLLRLITQIITEI
jgi:hypothetical protein